MKTAHILFISMLCAVAFPAFAQVNIGTVDPGPYTPGSTITAAFSLDPSFCVRPGNVFELYLSDDVGSFANERLIGTYPGFYSAFVNGVIPIGTTPGTGYKVRIKSTIPPAIVALPSNAFEIRAGGIIEARLTAQSQATLSPEAFGFCSGRTGASANINLTNQSTPLSTVTATITNQLNPTPPTTINFTTSPQTFSPQLAHYTVFVKAVMPDGTVATKNYFIINNNVNTSFTTSNEPIVCLPGGSLQYFIDVSSATGIQNNFPGNTYTINWGDGQTNIYTFCDLQGGTVSHSYTQSSCGQRYQSGNTTINNVFGVNIQASNTFCGNIGTQVSTIAKVVTITENRLTGPANACTNANVTFINTSILGQNPNSTAADCTDSGVRFNWYVNGQLILSDVPFTTQFSRVFNTPGVYRITLESTSETNCQGPPFNFNVCVQNAPIPSFTIPAVVCLTSPVTPTNTSVVDISCNNNVTYVWTASPSAGVTPSSFTTTSAIPPTFNFSQAGIYNINLTITTPNCGTSAVFSRSITVNSPPSVTLSPDITLCKIGEFDFSTANGPTRTVYSGTETVLDDVYSWTVTSNNGGTWTFITPSTSKYPTIKFNNFDVYTITSTVTNVCGTSSDSQTITFTESPIPGITVAVNPICNDANANLTGNITGTYTSFQWFNSAGTTAGFSDPTNLVTTYTPTTAERNAGIATVRLMVNTGLSGSCATVDDTETINIMPVNTGTNTTQSICTGAFATYNPISTVSGSTYTWTAANADGNATDFSASGSGNINDDINLINPNTSAVVIYTITPSSNGCTGSPFTFTVTVIPRPTASATNPTICSGQPAGITLTSNLGNTAYTWTSVPTAGINGNSNNATPITNNIINDILTNTTNSTGTVTYTITPNANGCNGTPIVVTVIVEPAPTPSNAGPDESICATSSYTLKGNQPSVGTGKWTQVSGPTTVTFVDDTQYNSSVNNLQIGGSYIFRWTITGATNCTPQSDDVSITINPLSVGGSTTGSTAVCAGNNSGTITLAGHTGNVIRWESSTDGGNTWLPLATTTTSYNYTNLTATTQFRAVVQSGACASANSSASIITVNQGVTVANAGTDQILCNANTTILNGNDPNLNTGQWSLISGQTGVTFDDPAKFNATISGLVGGQTYTFRWTISGSAPCPSSFDDVIVNNLPTLQDNTITTPITTACNGQVITLSGSTPTGGNGTYNYSWESSPTGNAPWTTITGQTGRDLNVTVTSTLSYRRLVNSGSCSSVSNVIAITALPAIANNIIASDQTICSTTTPLPITGTQPTGGDGINYAYGWEQSTDNGSTWVFVAGANGQNYTPPTLTQTTSYRRLVSSGPCTGSLQSISNVVKITVSENARAEFTYTNDVGCVPFVLDASNIKAVPYPAQNSTYSWYADNVLIGTGISFPGFTINADNQSVVIKLVTTSSLGCLPSETSHTFMTRQNIIASFTPSTTNGCGPLTVNFTNTSTSLIGVTFEWSVDDVVIASSTNFSYNFLGTTDGKDKTYTVKLVARTNCGATESQTTIMVKGNPIAAFFPDKSTGCSPFLVTFTNVSQSNFSTYTYDFGDGSPLVTTTSKDPVNHTFSTNVVRNFTIRMTEKNDCGELTNERTIVVSPNAITASLGVNGNNIRGCAPFTVRFFNNTVGASEYTYDFKDGTTPLFSANTGPETQTHVFNSPGTYRVELKATNACPSVDYAYVDIIVDPQPSASFTSNTNTGCVGLSVQFTNTSKDAISYSWDFGDGSAPSNDANPIHVFTGPPGQYNVKLTAINSLGCQNTTALNHLITIVGPPRAAFAISPAAVISIPDYTFRFTDESTNEPQTYKWSFGDGDISSLKDPTHKYSDTGRYLVTLRTYNEYGCVDSVEKYVQIVGVPGYLYLPNSFIPGGTSVPLQKFMALGSGIKSWRMSVFNKWGQVLWETTQLDDGKPVEGWDGTYKGVPQPQGIYFWKVDVVLVNGTEWKGMTYDRSAPKRTGEIYLIR